MSSKAFVVGAIPTGRPVVRAHCMHPNVTIGGEFPNVPNRQIERTAVRPYIRKCLYVAVEESIL